MPDARGTKVLMSMLGRGWVQEGRVQGWTPSEVVMRGACPTTAGTGGLGIQRQGVGSCCTPGSVSSSVPSGKTLASVSHPGEPGQVCTPRQRPGEHLGHQ